MAPKLRSGRGLGTLAALASAITLCAAGCGDRSAPDLVLTNARVVTLDSGDHTWTTLAIGGGKIVALTNGVDPHWLAFKPTVIDVGGAVVAPAFTDHHVHLLNVGMALLNARDGGRLGIDLTGVRSLAAVDSLVRARAATLPAGTWILGAGWSQANWGTSGLPTADLLTRAAPHHPVFLARTDGHAGWLNAPALAAAGITGATPSPEGGMIGHLPSGEPSGILLERANEMVTAQLPALADSDVVTAYRLAADALARRGVVEVYDAGPLMYPGVTALNMDIARYVTLLVRADSIAPLPLRINLMIPAPSRFADSLLGAAKVATELSPRIHITHLKLFSDGALGSRGGGAEAAGGDEGVGGAEVGTVGGFLGSRFDDLDTLSQRQGFDRLEEEGGAAGAALEQRDLGSGPGQREHEAGDAATGAEVEDLPLRLADQLGHRRRVGGVGRDRCRAEESLALRLFEDGGERRPHQLGRTTTRRRGSSPSDKVPTPSTPAMASCTTLRSEADIGSSACSLPLDRTFSARSNANSSRAARRLAR